jgi:chaperonin GroES
MKVQPLHDRILVRRLENEEKTAGGLYIPETAKEKPLQGQVIAAGRGKILNDGSRRALDIKEGDRVLFGKYAGTEIAVDGEDHLILREEDVLGIIQE